MTKSALLSPEVLEIIWEKWHLQKFNETPYVRYQRTHRTRNHRSREFESWLLAQGAAVTQINKQRHLKFYNEREATLFLMRWV